VPTLVPKPPSATVARHHSPLPVVCYRMPIAKDGRRWMVKHVGLKIRVPVIQFHPWPHNIRVYCRHMGNKLFRGLSIPVIEVTIYTGDIGDTALSIRHVPTSK